MIKNKKFPRGIEVLTATIIKNKKGEILIAQSPKFFNKWVVPGGHIEPGETILKAAKREAREETGLKLKPLKIVNFGEVINPKEFKRAAHMVYFICLLCFMGGKVKLQKEELVDFRWLKPVQALKLNLTTPHRKIIKDYINFLRD